MPSCAQLARNRQQDERPRVDPPASDCVRVFDEHDKHGLGTSALGSIVFGAERPQVPTRSVSAWRGWRVLALDATYRVRRVLRSCARDEAGVILTQLAQRALAEPAARTQQAQRPLCSLTLAREEERWRRTNCRPSALVRQRCSGTAHSRCTGASTHAPRCAATSNPRRRARTSLGCR